MRLGQTGGTHRGVDGFIALETAILAQPVMGLTKGNARNAAGDQAQVDGAEAGEEAVVPWLRIRRGLLVDVFAGPGENVVEASLPFLDVVVADRALLWGFLRGCHCVSSVCVCVDVKRTSSRESTTTEWLKFW